MKFAGRGLLEKKGETRLDIVVVTGLSGAGKSTALRILEDMGYFCVDNLPTPLTLEFVNMAETRSDIQRVALGIDTRGRVFGHGASELREELIQSGYRVFVIFFDATDEALIRRFSESRRPHPLAEGVGVFQAIKEERKKNWNIREQADEVIDTTLLNVHQLRRMLRHQLGDEQSDLAMDVRLVSFGFRYGIPVDADLVFDVRFLPNPYFVDQIKGLSGKDKEVSDYVMNYSESQEFLDRCNDFLNFLIPYYQKEGKSNLSVALGCTGGRHRSVTMVEALSSRLSLPHSVNIFHRDLERYNSDALTVKESTS